MFNWDLITTSLMWKYQRGHQTKRLKNTFLSRILQFSFHVDTSNRSRNTAINVFMVSFRRCFNPLKPNITYFFDILPLYKMLSKSESDIYVTLFASLNDSEISARSSLLQFCKTYSTSLSVYIYTKRLWSL